VNWLSRARMSIREVRDLWHHRLAQLFVMTQDIKALILFIAFFLIVLLLMYTVYTQPLR
jgi:hypothetical protein